MKPPLLTIDQVAARLVMHERTVRWFISRGQLRALKIGSRWRFDPKDLDAFEESRRHVVVKGSPVTTTRKATRIAGTRPAWPGIDRYRSVQ